MPRCPNCKAKMDYEAPNYVCKSCGLVVNRFEFDKMKRQHFNSRRDYEDPEDEHKREREDYLDWWLSSNKDSEED